MKILEMILGFLTQQGRAAVQENAESMTRQIANNARRISKLLALTAIFVALLCSGITSAYSELMSSIQRSETNWTGAIFLGGLALAIASIGGLVYSLGEKRWLEALNVSTDPPPPPQASPIENAIAVLLLEAANELRERRKSPGESHETRASAPGADENPAHA